MSYQQIADDLTARIDSGEYQPGGQLPSLQALAGLYQVSVSKVQRALIVLRTRGQVRGVSGRGVFVTDGDDTQPQP